MFLATGVSGRARHSWYIKLHPKWPEMSDSPATRFIVEIIFWKAECVREHVTSHRIFCGPPSWTLRRKPTHTHTYTETRCRLHSGHVTAKWAISTRLKEFNGTEKLTSSPYIQFKDTAIVLRFKEFYYKSSLNYSFSFFLN